MVHRRDAMTLTTTHSIKLNTGAWMPKLALGTGFDRPSPRGLNVSQMVRRGLDMGYRHIETAEVYPNFLTIKPVLKDVARHSYFITTKVDPTIGKRRRQCADNGDGCFLAVQQATKDVVNKALGLEYVDLLLLHRPPARTPGAGTFEAQRSRAPTRGAHRAIAWRACRAGALLARWTRRSRGLPSTRA